MDNHVYDPTRGYSTGPAVLDQYGRPFRQSEGYEPYLSLPHPGQFANLFSGAYKTYLHGGADAGFTHDPEFCLALLRDPHIMRCVNEIHYAVTSLNVHLETDDDLDPVNRAVRDGVWATLKATPYFKQMVKSLCWADWYGKYAVQIAYKWRTMLLTDPDNPRQKIPTRCPVIVAHEPVEGDKIGWNFKGEPYVQVNYTVANKIPDAELITTYGGSWGLVLRGTWRDKFIIHQHERLDMPYMHAEMGSSIYGVGMRNTIYWLAWLRQELMSHILQYVERTGLGLRIWYYDANSPDSKAAVEEASKHQGDRTNLLVPRFLNQTGKGAELVEIKETSTGGANLLLGILQEWQDQIALYIVGQTLSSGTEGSGLGGTGVASRHADSKYRIVESRACNLAETMTVDWARKVLAWQYPEYADLPLRLVFDLDAPDIEARLAAIEKAFNMGVDFRKSEVRKLTGMSDPVEGDETISKAQTMQQEAAMQPQPGMPVDGDRDGFTGDTGDESEEDMSWLTDGLMSEMNEMEGAGV